MMDLILPGFGCGGFLLLYGYAVLCDRLWGCDAVRLCAGWLGGCLSDGVPRLRAGAARAFL